MSVSFLLVHEGVDVHDPFVARRALALLAQVEGEPPTFLEFDGFALKPSQVGLPSLATSSNFAFPPGADRHRHAASLVSFADLEATLSPPAARHAA